MRPGALRRDAIPDGTLVFFAAVSVIIGVKVGPAYPGIRAASSAKALSMALQRANQASVPLATGQQINRAADGPAALISSENLRAVLAALEAEAATLRRADAVPVAGEPRYRRLALAAIRRAERADPGHPTIQRFRQAALVDRGIRVRAPSTVDIVTASSPPIPISVDSVGGSPLTPTIDGVAACVGHAASEALNNSRRPLASGWSAASDRVRDSPNPRCG